jgi:hypothetical protein
LEAGDLKVKLGEGELEQAGVAPAQHARTTPEIMGGVEPRGGQQEKEEPCNGGGWGGRAAAPSGFRMNACFAPAEHV